MKKIIFCLFVLIMLSEFIPATGGAGNTQAKPESDNQEINLLNADASLLKELEAKVKAKAGEYREGNFSENQIAQQQIKIHHVYSLEKKENETEFNRKYDRLQNYLYRLAVIKLNLYNIQEEIKSRIIQNTGLTRTISEEENNRIINEYKENNRKINEYNLKQRLQSIPYYFLIIGKSVDNADPGKDNRQQIIDEMKEFLIEQKLQIEFTPSDEFPPLIISLNDNSIVPDGREYCEVKNKTVYVYKVFCYYPFTINDGNDKPLPKIYQNFFNTGNTANIADFSIKPGKGWGKNIKCIDLNAGGDTFALVMNFFDCKKKDFLGFPGSSLIADLKKAYQKNLETINRGIAEYREKSRSISKELSNINDRLDGISGLLKNLSGKFKTVLTDLSTFAANIQQETATNDLKKIKNDIDSSIKTLLGNLAKDDEFRQQEKTIAASFKELFSIIDKLTLALSQEEKNVIGAKKMLFLVCGESTAQGQTGNETAAFVNAANNALDLIWKEMRLTCAGIAAPNENGDINIMDKELFCQQSKIEELAVPLVYKTNTGAVSTDSRYRIYLKIKIGFPSMFSPVRKIYVDIDTVNDPENHLTWTKDMGEYLTYYGGYSDTVESRLSKLNGSLPENERINWPWLLVTKNDLEKLLKRQDMRDALNIRLNRNYWTAERVGIYYRCYRFQENGNGSLELLQEKLISSDGASCIFVRKMK